VRSEGTPAVQFILGVCSRLWDRREDAKRPSLLLAEDDPHVAAAFVRLLSNDFDVVCVVSDGEALIERTHELLPDLVVTDVVLNALDGISATLAVRRRYPTLPGLVITGHSDRSMMRSRALAAGASAFLPKNEVAHALVRLLQSLLR
jgi:DNA-binding NarL/FixJ family response regulator